MTPSIAYKLNDAHSVGFTFVLAGQYFRAEGLEDFGFAGFTSGGAATTEAEAQQGLTGQGFSHSFGYGFRLGWLGKFLDDDLKLGFNYSAKVHMSKFSRYDKLFAEQGDLDIPAHYGLGVSYVFMPQWTMAFDVMQIEWSSVASIGNKGPALYTGDPLNTAVGGGAGALGRDDGMGFGWEDQTVYKLGFHYQYTTDTAFTMGVNY